MTSCTLPRFGAAIAVGLAVGALLALGGGLAGAQQLDTWGSLRQGYTNSPVAAPSRLGHDRRPLDGTYRRAANPEYDYTPPPIWNGVYLGGHFGYSIAEMSGPRFDNLESSGGVFGGHLGYNWQAGNIVLGLESDWSWHDNGGSREYSGYANLGASLDQAASLRVRLGYTFDNAMIYATAGGAAASASIAQNLGPYQTRQQEMLYGYAVGAGLEVKLSHNTSGRIEAMYYGFDDKTFHFNSGWMAIDTGVMTVRAGLTFHFQ